MTDVVFGCDHSPATRQSLESYCQYIQAKVADDVIVGCVLVRGPDRRTALSAINFRFSLVYAPEVFLWHYCLDMFPERGMAHPTPLWLDEIAAVANDRLVIYRLGLKAYMMLQEAENGQSE